MKWIYLIIIASFCSTLSWSQGMALKTIKGKVTFDKDSTDWIATIIEKDTVSVLFKMMFDKLLNQQLPPNGYYQISYGADIIQFKSINKPESYSFYTDHMPITGVKRGERRWPIIGLARMNPVCVLPRN
jgi:hypothetical protein